MATNACWGVEVGANAVKAIKLVAVGDGFKVADFAIIPHKKVLSTPDIDENDARRVALGTLVAQHDLSKAGLAISVAGHSAFARFAKLPPVEPSKIPDIVKFEAVQQIPFAIEEVQWDYQTFENPGSPDVEVGIFAITTEKVMDLLAKWQDVGRVPDILTLSPLAVYNAVAYDQEFSEQTPGTVILDIGTTSTDLIVADRGRLWIRTFPIGGHHFTEALVTNFNLSYSKAEKLKREAETSQHARQILQAMRPVFTDLAQDVQRSMGYYQSLHRDCTLTRVIGVGSTFHLPGLRKFLSQQLGVSEVARLETFNRIKVEGPRAAEFNDHVSNLATAYGLALQGLGAETIGANLMPVAVVREAMWKSKTPWFAAAAAISIAAGAATFIRPMMDARAASQGAPPRDVERVAREINQHKQAWEQIRQEHQPNPRALLAKGLLDGRDIMPALVEDMSRISALLQSGLMRQPVSGGPGTQAARYTFRSFDAHFGGRDRAPLGGPGGGIGGPGGIGPGGPGFEPGFGGGAMGEQATGGRPRVTLSLQFSTSLGTQEVLEIEPQLRRWFEENRVRPVGYEIVPFTPDASNRGLLEILRVEEITAPGTPSGGTPPPPQPLPGRPGGPGGPFGPGGVGGPGGMGGPGGPGGLGGGGLGGPGGPGEGGPGRGPGAVPPAAPGDLNAIAPLVLPPEALPDPGSRITTYRLVWEVELKSPTLKEAGQ
jgi:type IV pilus assembly protein PilM